MRVAILGDMHGNLIAFDAVLADIQKRGGVDAYWLLGDYCAFGSDPSGVIERIKTLRNVVTIRGNTDRTTITRNYPPLENAVDANHLQIMVDTRCSYEWGRGFLAARGGLDWLAALPLDYRETLPDGTRVLVVHARPGQDSGNGLNNILSDDEFRAALTGADADLVIVGHTHCPLDRRLDGVRAVNPGSVSNQIIGETRVPYIYLTADEYGHDLAFRRVEYDVDAALEALRRSGIPSADFFSRALLAQEGAPWQVDWDYKSYLPEFET